MVRLEEKAAERAEGHALVTMLALTLTRRLRERVAPLGLTSEDAVARLVGVRLVGLGPEAHNLWRLPDSMPAAQQEIPAVLPTLGSPLLSLKNRSNAVSNLSLKPPFPLCKSPRLTTAGTGFQ